VAARRSRLSAAIDAHPDAPQWPWWSLRLAEWQAYLHYIGRRPSVPGKRFVVFAHFRTGSHLLTGMLDAHPQVHCELEIFRPFLYPRQYHVLSPHSLLKSRVLEVPGNVYGFNLKLYQLRHLLWRRIHPEPRAVRLHEDGWQFIFLSRKNLLRQAISNLIANDSIRWHRALGETRSTQRFHLEPARLLKQIAWFERVAVLEAEAMDDIPHLRLFYESDFLDASTHQATLDRAFDYLDLPRIPVEASMQRVAPLRLGDNIENFSEIVEAIRGTPYAPMLEQR
jgi:hypothetical protein